MRGRERLSLPTPVRLLPVVIEQAIGIDDLGGGGLIYGSALVGLLPAVVVGRPATPLPGWFDGAAIERRLSE